MHIHNVADYAPTGHQLLRTEYEGGATRHVFRAPDGAERVCEVIAKNADEERAQLERFKEERETVMANERALAARGIQLPDEEAAAKSARDAVGG